MVAFHHAQYSIHDEVHVSLALTEKQNGLPLHPVFHFLPVNQRIVKRSEITDDPPKPAGLVHEEDPQPHEDRAGDAESNAHRPPGSSPTENTQILFKGNEPLSLFQICAQM